MKDFLVRLAILSLLFVAFPLVLVFVLFGTNNIDTIKVYNCIDKKVVDMDFDQYLIGVVAAEMPANFNMEALKAQAVAARTYAAKRKNSDFPEHEGADICTDFSHCQAYLDNNELKDKWGKNYKKYYKKIKNCVNYTENECLVYNDEYATAVFHSCSNGKTENASDVWGGNVEYLVSVESPWDLEKKDYIKKQSYSLLEFNNIISDNDIKCVTPNGELPIVGDVILTQGDNVASMVIYGQIYTGVELRKIFSLKSSAFSVICNDDIVEFTVYGSGHGVGMSQYGAQGMAHNGKLYDEILYHYYPGVKIVNCV